MRGKIIQYNGADGSGTLVIDGRQHRFTLDAWRAESAPAINKVVEVTLDHDLVTAVAAVGDDVLLKEKAAQLGGKLGALLGKIPTAVPVSTNTPAAGAAAVGTPADTASSAAPMSRSIVERYGKPMLAAYVSFVIGTLAFNAVSVSAFGQGVGKSLFDISGLMSQLGGSGGGSIKAMLLLAYASIAAPMFWHERRAWLAMLLPLLALLWAAISTFHALDALGGAAAGGLSDFFSISFGFYLSLAAALVLAVLGLKRALGAA